MGSEGKPAASPAIHAAALSLRIDTVTAEVVARLRAVEVEPILLKGPSIAAWLHADGAPRSYVDTDLLVAPEALPRAERALRNAGFRRGRPGWQEVSFAWRRKSDGSLVDLHTSLFGIGASPEAAWSVLRERTQPMRVGGEEVKVLSRPALAFHVALHAAQHGSEGGTPEDDLLRALRIADIEDWRRAAEIAAQLEATAAFVTGLALEPKGSGVIARLGLLSEPSTAVALHAGGAPPLVLGLEHMASSPGWRARLRFLARKLAPAPRDLRAQSVLARRGVVGLVLAYMMRPFRMLGHFPRALLHWRRARSTEASQRLVGGPDEVDRGELKRGDHR